MLLTPENLKESIDNDSKKLDNILSKCSNIKECRLFIDDIKNTIDVYTDSEINFYNNGQIYLSKLCLEFIDKLVRTHAMCCSMREKYIKNLYRNTFGMYVIDIKKYVYDNPTKYKTYCTLLVSDNFEYFKEEFFNLLNIDNIDLSNSIDISQSDNRIFAFTHGASNFVFICCNTAFVKESVTGLVFNEITCIDNYTKDNSWIEYIKQISPNAEHKVIKIHEVL